MKTIRELLEEHPFFQGLEPRYLDLIVGCAVNVHFDVGNSVFKEGDPANQFYLIREGQVALEANTSDDSPVLIETIESADVLGWSWLFPPHQWQFDARALEPTRAIAFDGTCLREKCKNDHDLGYELVMRFAKIITERLQATRLQLIDYHQRG